MNLVHDSNEAERLAQMKLYEQELWRLGFNRIAGLDEVGRGCLAGPVVVAAVILPPDAEFIGINDSKQLSQRQRERLAEEIKALAQDWTVTAIAAPLIDELNILAATRMAMHLAVRSLNLPPDHLLIDALNLPALGLPQQAIVKGDQRSMSIAAASILAKVERDAMMRAWAESYPYYGFERHFGYGTAIHQQALSEYGPCPLHRMSFAPLRAWRETAAALQPELF